MLCCSLDWLEFTCKKFIEVSDLLDYMNFSLDNFIQLPKALFGYKSMIKHEEYPIYILFDGNAAMAIHVRISGSAIDFFLEHWKCDAQEGIQRISDIGDFTRIDIALDDVGSEYFTIPNIYRYLRSDSFTGNFRNYSIVRMYNAESNSKSGDTIYLGKRSSNVFFRLYDKRLETIHKLDEDPGIEITRWELECKHESAEKVSDLIICYGLQNAFQAVLRNHFTLIHKDATRKCRCSILKKYEDFIESVPAASISKSKKILSIDQSIKWLIGQCSKAYALAVYKEPGFAERLLNNGIDRITENDLNKLNY